MSVRGKNILYGLYNDETDLLKAVKEAKSQHLEILDVFTPFPVHGLDPLLGLKESRLHIAGFVYGLAGTITAFGFMTWALAADWPIIYGGKPYWPVPSFIPVTFELTVLFASVGMVVTFYTICGMAPGVENPIIDKRITDDKFCIAFDLSKYEGQKDKLEAFFSTTGAEETDEKSFE
jgi:hypothetical protein